MSSQVPTPRQFLTSLIESLNSIPTPPTPQPSATSGNSLKLIPPAHRPLLTTLYALYPLTLLPALDLLDRRLASRIIVAPSRSRGDTTTTISTAPEEKGQPPPFYIVRSAQPQHPRRDTTSASAPGPRYVVRLSAWNCSCAAFAFAAFPRGEDRYAVSSASSTPQQIRKDDKDDNEALEWQFGALSLDGTEGSGIAGVPCCKHLLACVLAERWSAVLGGYVDERVVGKEEAAGLVVDV
ncbi:hypothetical protein GL218_00296 [Daldinia childiae]|uniref:uncharacterized protein n=1 Tax=Daldinia childiae TaxID=326645 RepID=UPI0014463807|nr:uncharacterized protein GL218_00296 [Daldinia childiae]KAF3070711.1 hypothetical protein GL218_00296 [Daldinia childiae]